MKLLLIHNSHRSGSSSGDDGVFGKECALLKKQGHLVTAFNPSNDEFDRTGLIKKLSIALQVPWSIGSYYEIKELITREKPDIVHIHNFFPFISPSVYYAARSEGVPVIQTLHDFRFLCVMAFFMRDRRICEECRDGSVFRSVWYGCFKNSRLQSIPVALMLKLHQTLQTFKEKIDAYICLTDFEKKIFSDSGFANDKLFVKPNFVEDLLRGNEGKKGEYAVFIGRLGEEKGILTLINAWRGLPEVPLKIVGDGPEANACKTLIRSLNIKNIDFLGYLSQKDCMNVLDNSLFLIMPSICYETFGLVIIEAFSHCKPVIASNLGAMADLVRDQETGLLFTPMNTDELVAKVRWLWNNPEEAMRMGQNARREYEAKYTPEKNYEMLMKIYRGVIERKRGTKTA